MGAYWFRLKAEPFYKETSDMSDSKALGAAELALSTSANRKWWQRLFLYPTVVGALIGAIPTGMDYYKAFVYDIEFSSVRHAEEQRRLWIKNFACAQNIKYQQVKTAENTLVKVGACINGDVLIEVVVPAMDRIVEWISLDRLKTSSAVSSLSFIGTAHASASAVPSASTPKQSMIHLAQASSTKCQAMRGKTKIIRVVQEGNACYLEEIDVMKGKVVSRRPVPCSTPC
jgi:hypothetical protein